MIITPLLGEHYLQGRYLYDVKAGRIKMTTAREHIESRVEKYGWILAPAHTRNHWAPSVFFKSFENKLAVCVYDSAPSLVTFRDWHQLFKMDLKIDEVRITSLAKQPRGTNECGLHVILLALIQKVNGNKMHLPTGSDNPDTITLHDWRKILVQAGTSGEWKRVYLDLWNATCCKDLRTHLQLQGQRKTRAAKSGLRPAVERSEGARQGKDLVATTKLTHGKKVEKQPEGGGSGVRLTLRPTMSLWENTTVEEPVTQQELEKATEPAAYVHHALLREAVRATAEVNKQEDDSKATYRLLPVATTCATTAAWRKKSKRQRVIALEKSKALKGKSMILLCFVKGHFLAVKFMAKSGILVVSNSLRHHQKELTEQMLEDVRAFLQELNDTNVVVRHEETEQQTPGDNDCAFKAAKQVAKWIRVKLDWSRQQITPIAFNENSEQNGPSTVKPEEQHRAEPHPKPQSQREESKKEETEDPRMSYMPKSTRSGSDYKQVLKEVARTGHEYEAHILWSNGTATTTEKHWWGGTAKTSTTGDKVEVRWTHVWMTKGGAWRAMQEPQYDTLPAPTAKYKTWQLSLEERHQDATQRVFRAQVVDDVQVRAEDMRHLTFTNDRVRGMRNQTIAEHRSILRLIVERCQLPEHEGKLIGKAVGDILQNCSDKQGWKATTLARKAGSAVGAMGKLPLYTNLSRGIQLSASAHWKMFMRRAKMKGEAAVVAFPCAMTAEQAEGIAETLHRTGPTTPKEREKLAVLISYATAARFGDCTKLQGRDLRIGGVDMDNPKGTVQCLFVRGKSARLGIPHRVTMPLTHVAIFPRLQKLKQETGEADFVFYLPNKARVQEFYAGAREVLKRSSPQLELRSMRRGRLQDLADKGMDLADLIKVSGHRQPDTLLRYLGWGEKARADRERLLRRANEAVRGGGEQDGAPAWWAELGYTTPPMSEFANEEQKNKARERLHVKRVGPVRMERMDELAVEVGMGELWRTVSKYIRDPSCYEDLPETPVRHTTLKSDFIQKMCEYGQAKKVDVEQVKAYIRLTGVLEVEKQRTRAIKHPPEINELIPASMLHKIQLPTLKQQFDQVNESNITYVEELDGAAFFDAFEVNPEVASYQAFKSNGGTFVYTRMLMGVRYAVSIAQVAMEILAQKAVADAKVTTQTNIDNVRFAGGTREQVREVTERFREIAASANIDITQPEQDTVDGWKAGTHKWLGVMYDVNKKQVWLAKKSIDKIKAGWQQKQWWTNRKMAAHLSMLFWATRVLDLSVATKFEAMRAYRALAKQLQEEPDLWDSRAEKLPPKAAQDLERWTMEALTNQPRNIKPADHTSTIFVDASKWGWGAIALDHEEQTVTQIGKRWDASTARKGVEHSTTAEPIGVTRAVKSLVKDWARHQKVRVFTDSITAKAAHTRGYAADYNINATVRERERAMPNTQVELRHVPGSQNPADGISRGMAPEIWSVGELTKRVNGALEGYPEELSETTFPNHQDGDQAND